MYLSGVLVLVKHIQYISLLIVYFKVFVRWNQFKMDGCPGKFMKIGDYNVYYEIIGCGEHKLVLIPGALGMWMN